MGVLVRSSLHRHMYVLPPSKVLHREITTFKDAIRPRLTFGDESVPSLHEVVFVPP